MQDVSRSVANARVLVFESSADRAAMITERFLDHGIDAIFAKDLSEIPGLIQSKKCHVLLLNDASNEAQDLLGICAQIKIGGSPMPDIILATDNSRLSLRECHEAGCSHLVRRTLDFNDLCDLIERTAQVSGKRLYDGKQLQLAKRFGPLNRSGSESKGGHRLTLTVNDVARGGFYFETELENIRGLQEGALVQFEVSLAMFPNYSFQGKGYVSWMSLLEDGKTGVGIEFALIPAESEQLLRAFSDLFKVQNFIPTPALSSEAGMLRYAA